MGCDIHAHVETGHLNREGKMTWNHLCDFRFGRNYVLFALMAGVRRYSYMPNADLLEVALAKRGVNALNDPLLSEEETQVIIKEASDNGITSGQPSFEEKGAPRDMDWKTAEGYTYNIVEDGEENEDSEAQCVARSKAEQWIKEGSSEVWDTAVDGTILRITGPDWHTASWLDTKEMILVAQRMELAMAGHPYRNDTTIARLEGLVEMMKRLERDEKTTARVVFWFDN